jgi:hypothetical protein
MVGAREVGAPKQGTTKRKRQDEEDDCVDEEDNLNDETTANAIMGPSGSTRATSTVSSVPPSASMTDLQTILPAPKNSVQNHRVITLSGVQRGLTDLRTTVEELSAAFQILSSENMMLRGWMETLMVLKDQMSVSVPALEAELRGLRQGMELEQMKSEIRSLHGEMASMSVNFAELGPERDSEDEEGDEANSLPAAHHPAPADVYDGVTVQGPRSSMYVAPTDFRQRTERAAMARLATVTSGTSLGCDDGDSPAPMPTTAISPVTTATSNISVTSPIAAHLLKSGLTPIDPSQSGKTF